MDSGVRDVHADERGDHGVGGDINELAAAGAAVTASVGAYQLEGLGAQLFAKVEGDFFTILGLPLLPLLDFLRGHGIVAE